MRRFLLRLLGHDHPKSFTHYKLADGRMLTVNEIGNGTTYNVYHPKSSYFPATMAFLREQVRVLERKLSRQKKRITALQAENKELRDREREHVAIIAWTGKDKGEAS